MFGSLAQTLALDSMTNTNAKIDVGKMPYIGRVVTNIDVGAALAKTGIKSFEDVRAKQYNVGASGGGSTTVLFPTALNTYGGAKFKLIRGYSGTINILLAMERSEVDIVGAYGLPGILVSHPGWVHKDEATILYQASLKRHRLLANVPTLPELAQSDEGRDGAARGGQYRRRRTLHSDNAGRAPGTASGAAIGVSSDAQGSGFPRGLREAKHDDRWRNRGRDRSNRPRYFAVAAGRGRENRANDAVAEVPDAALMCFAYSTVAPENLTTLPHFSVSLAIILENSPGEPPRISAPISAKRDRSFCAR